MDYSPPVFIQERIICSIEASLEYQIPVNILLAIAEKEGGRPHEWSYNQNGTYDVGPMQFNTRYLKELEKYGISSKDVEQEGCYPYELAAWRIRNHLREGKKDIWTLASNYHSRTPKYNEIYRKDLIKKAQKWQHWLEQRFPTFDATTANSYLAKGLI